MSDETSNLTRGLALPPGLSLRRQGEGLEKVTVKSGDLQLLVSGNGTELVEFTLHKGEALTLAPPEDEAGRATEICYLLDGVLTCDLPSGAANLQPRDYLVAEALDGPIFLTAASDVRLLYITSQPFFHEISQDMQELMTLAVEVEMKDGYTADHCLRLQKLSLSTGRELSLDPHRLDLLQYGSYLHDVGKIKVPQEILQKPAALTPDEWQVIHRHPIFGRELLEKTFMKHAGPIVEQHHERLDGSGYPLGIVRDEVLVESYIVAVADTYDAMTTDRPYRRALSQEEAFEEIRRYADVHYPSEVTSAFFSAIKQEVVKPAQK